MALVAENAQPCVCVCKHPDVKLVADPSTVKTLTSGTNCLGSSTKPNCWKSETKAKNDSSFCFRYFNLTCLNYSSITVTFDWSSRLFQQNGGEKVMETFRLNLLFEF